MNLIKTNMTVTSLRFKKNVELFFESRATGVYWLYG